MKRILLSNNALHRVGGTETFTFAMAQELVRRGYKVDVFTLSPGLVSQYMQESLGVRLVNGNGNYDVVLANHSSTVKILRSLHSGFIVQTCHGVTTALEQPSPFAHAFVGISQELVAHIESITEKKAICIMNGIDCSRYYPSSPLNKSVKRVLSLSQNESLNEVLKSDFISRGIEFDVLNKFKNPVWNVEKYINQADMVVSFGRGAYESMACGRPVLVLDHRPKLTLQGDGLILPDNVQEIMWSNCRGVAFRNNNIKEMIDHALDYYSPQLGEWCRHYAISNLNIQLQVTKYIELCNQLIWYMS